MVLFFKTLHLPLIFTIFSGIGKFVKHGFDIFQIANENVEQDSNMYVLEISFTVQQINIY